MEDSDYFSRINPDLFARIPLTAKRILEVGCGTGAVAQAYLARNPTATYYGVELFEEAGRKAATRT